MTSVLEIHQQPNDLTTFQLDQAEGEQLRSLLIRETNLNFNTYLNQIGLQPTNVFNYLSGRNRLTLKVLQKLIAGTELEIRCSLSIQILKNDGSNVNNADSMNLEEMLFYTGQDMLETD